MRGLTNVISNKSNNLKEIIPFQFVLTLNNNYANSDNSNRNYAYFNCPNKEKYTTLKVLRTECGGLSESDGIRDIKCDARIHWGWTGSWTPIKQGLTYYEEEPIMTIDISNTKWNDDEDEINFIGISGNYNTLAKVYFELS